MARKTRTPILVTLDTETIGLDGALRRIAIYDGQNTFFGYSFNDIKWRLDELHNDGFFPHIYIHNADFDLRKIPEFFDPGNVLWNTTLKINNRYARLTCKNYTIHDSFRILPQSLDSLCKDFQLAAGKLDLWKAVQEAYPEQYESKVDFLNRCPVDDPVYLKYLGLDVTSLYDLLQKLMEIAKLQTDEFIKIVSTASLSRYILRNGYGGMIFKDENRDKTDYEFLTSCKAWNSEKKMKYAEISYQECEYRMRAAYFGGRCEVFTPLCSRKAYHYDVNSLYPSVMINELPIGYPEFIGNPDIARITFQKWQRRREGLGFVECVVNIPAQAIPPLPARMGKLAFVTGVVSGTWTYIELQYAIENCGVEILEYRSAIHFAKTFPVFRRFVKEFYKIKEQAGKDGNKSLRTLAKLVLNTGYGYTGMRRDDKTALRDIDKLDEWREKNPDRILYTNESMGFFEVKDIVTADTIQVQVAAYVTSYARLVLLDALRKQAEKGTVYYCDTDSIVCSEPMPPELVGKDSLGLWDLEKTIDSGIFLQPKVYTEIETDGTENIKFKGVTRDRQAELTPEYYEGLYGKIRSGKYTSNDKKSPYYKKITVETGRESLPTLAVAQKNGKDPNKLNKVDKSINLAAKQKRRIDYGENYSEAWHFEKLEDFEGFRFTEFTNAPADKNIFGG